MDYKTKKLVDTIKAVLNSCVDEIDNDDYALASNYSDLLRFYANELDHILRSRKEWHKDDQKEFYVTL